MSNSFSKSVGAFPPPLVGILSSSAFCKCFLAGLKSPNPTIIWTLLPVREKKQPKKTPQINVWKRNSTARFPQTVFTDNNAALWLLSYFFMYFQDKTKGKYMISPNFCQKGSSQSIHLMTAPQEDNFSHPKFPAHCKKDINRKKSHTRGGCKDTSG